MKSWQQSQRFASFLSSISHVGTYQFILYSSGILQALSNAWHGLRRLTCFCKGQLQPLELSLAVSLPCLSLVSGPSGYLPIRYCISFIHFCMVKWESYNLLGQALDYCTVLDDFVAKNRDLHRHELQDKDWVSITLVAKWLKSFQSAMTQISTTKCLMLSWTHAIFQGLQDSLADSLWSLPSNTPSPLWQCPLKAHCKLSDYYGKSDESPYYT